MKKVLSALLLTLLLGSSLALAATFGDVDRIGSCQYCGMDRAKFAHSRMLVEYDDASAVGLCSLHCAAVDLANNLDKMPTAIKVADYGSHELIDAEQASWILGGDQNGVMTGRAKWAFATADAAEAFRKEHGGEAVGFEEAIRAAYEDMYQDTRMIRDKRKAKRMQKP